jgi:hypothetical protein
MMKSLEYVHRLIARENFINFGRVNISDVTFLYILVLTIANMETTQDFSTLLVKYGSYKFVDKL